MSGIKQADALPYGRLVTIFDTAVASTNLGDQIIMDAVRRQLGALLPGRFFVNTPTHEIIGETSYALVEKSDFSFVGGTNLLSSNMNKYNQWKIGRAERKRLKNLLLLGVGWWQYQDAPNRYTRKLLQAVLHPTKLHSVRDAYTQKKLAEAGITNVVNTSCVTMWDLTPDHCAQIPSEKGDAVVATLTDYNRHPEHDSSVLQALERSYSKVFLWLQGVGDFAYARSLSLPKIEFIEPSLRAFSQLLSSNISLDYVGTRLHAGVHALTHKRRALILSVDNRAIEAGRDFGLPVLDRARTDLLHERIHTPAPLAITLPFERIEAWKAQFAGAVL